MFSKVPADVPDSTAAGEEVFAYVDTITTSLST